MDSFTGRKPNLIGQNMQKTVAEMINKPKINNTVSDKVMGSLSYVYDNYVKNYWIVIIIIICVTVYLIYRYNNKGQKTEVFVSRNNDIDKDLIDEYKKHQEDMLLNENIHANPLYNESDQYLPPTNYPPEKLPIRINDEIVYTTGLEHAKKETPLNYPKNYDYDGVYKNKLSYYTGTFNTYDGAQDTDIENPYGWSNKFNTTSGKFVKSMTDVNRQVNNDYQTISDNINGKLVNNLQSGISQYDSFHIEPPYEN